MGIFSGFKGKGKLVMVFHIGSSSVAGALFTMEGSGIPNIIFCAREDIQIEQEVSSDKFLSSTIDALKKVTEQIHKSGFGAPEKIFCVLSSPWYASQTRVINLTKNTPFVFNSKLADSLVQKEIAVFEQENLAKYKGSGNAVRPIELKNIKIVLNGYETMNPIGQKAKELEMTIFVSMSSEQVLKQIESAIAAHFHFKEIKYSSFVMASFATVREMYPKQDNFLLADIGGEVTDISMIKKDILRESISFPLGRNFLTRGVATSLNCTLAEADSFISLYKDGHAEPSVAKKLTPILDQLKREWLKKFQESLANLSHDISIPATIYIAINKDLADFFTETIKSEQFNQYTLTESKFEVSFLGSEALHGMATFRDNITRDPFLIIDSIYINRFLIHHTSDKI